MANEQGPQIIITRNSDADYSASQYHFVKASGSGANTITICTAQGGDAFLLGVLQNKPNAAGQPAEVLIFGISKVKCNDAIEDGAAITTETDGKADVAAGSDYVCGKSLHGKTSVDGDIITCAINLMAPYIY